MSSPSDPIQSGQSPFVAVTTPAIERANRLISVRSNPGFLDILRISQEIIQEAVDNCSDYGGWDPQQITVLKVRMQVAKEHHIRLLFKINEAIEAGVAESKAQLETMQQTQRSTISAQEAVESGDFVRQRVLEHFADNDLRVPGSY
jgi:hypothetical protein